RMDARYRHGVAGERLSGEGISDGGGENALPFRCQRHAPDHGGVVGVGIALAEPFVSEEEEGAVPAFVNLWDDHRAAQRRAELVLGILSPPLREERACHEDVVPDELKYLAVG